MKTVGVRKFTLGTFLFSFIISGLFSSALFAATGPVLWTCQTDLSGLQSGNTASEVQVILWNDENGNPMAEFYLGQITSANSQGTGASAKGLAFSQAFLLSSAASQPGNMVQGTGTWGGSNVNVYPMGMSGSIQAENITFSFPTTSQTSSTLTVGKSSYPLACSSVGPEQQAPMTVQDCDPAPSAAPVPTPTITITPQGNGPCDDANYQTDPPNRDDTLNIQTQLDCAAGKGSCSRSNVVFAPGIYCVTGPLNVSGHDFSIQGAGMAYPNPIEGAANATVLEVPKYTVWNNWCSNECKGNSCPQICQVSGYKTPPQSFVGQFVFNPASYKNTTNVKISGLSIYSNNDTFYPVAPGKSGIYQYAPNPKESPQTVAIQKIEGTLNCKNGPWIKSIAGGIEIGVGWTVDGVEVNSTSLWGYQARHPYATIKNSVSTGNVCNDAIGGGGGGFPSNMVGPNWTPADGLSNFLLGANTQRSTCPGVHVSNHLWTKDLQSASSAMDIMDTVGVVLENSTNNSYNNHVSFEGLRDSQITGNHFNSLGNIIVHGNSEYAYNAYKDGKHGQIPVASELKVVTMPRDIQVTGNVLNGGSAIYVSFDDTLIPTPFSKVKADATTPMPIGPIKGGHITVQGNQIYDATYAGIRWSETTSVSVGQGIIGGDVSQGNLVKNASACSQSNSCEDSDGKKHFPGFSNSGMYVNKDKIGVMIQNNTLDNGENQMACGVQGNFADQGQKQQNNTFVDLPANEDLCSLNPQ